MASGINGRYLLVPRTSGGRAETPGPRMRRFSLARVAVSPRSALGHDRHERLERVVEAEREAGAEPGDEVAA
jgi:hypothetical protein